jgi:hypothetical protein
VGRAAVSGVDWAEAEVTEEVTGEGEGSEEVDWEAAGSVEAADSEEVGVSEAAAPTPS